MAEDWGAIAQEVEDALRSVGQDTAGWPISLRRTTEGVRVDPWEPNPSESLYDQLWGIQDYKQLKDVDGTLTDQTIHTITINATGPVPTEDMHIALGVLVEEVMEETPWIAIKAVRPLAPAGVAVLYEIDLVE